MRCTSSTSFLGSTTPERTTDGRSVGSWRLWSCISEMSGDTTSVTPSCSSVGSWYVSDFPLPVGDTKS